MKKQQPLPTLPSHMTVLSKILVCTCLVLELGFVNTAEADTKSISLCMQNLLISGTQQTGLALQPSSKLTQITSLQSPLFIDTKSPYAGNLVFKAQSPYSVAVLCSTATMTYPDTAFSVGTTSTWGLTYGDGSPFVAKSSCNTVDVSSNTTGINIEESWGKDASGNSVPICKVTATATTTTTTTTDTSSTTTTTDTTTSSSPTKTKTTTEMQKR